MDSNGTAGTLFPVEGTGPTLPASDETLEEIAAEAIECRLCRLCEERTQVVFGVGDPDADLMFIGEAPGRNEDLQGEPFVGRAGQLLDKIIRAMGLRRDDVYITNANKCRPPNNRNPQADEIAACKPYLDRQLAVIRPRVIVLLGRVAVQSVLGRTDPLSKLRGRFVHHHGIPVMCTYHPAYLLRNPNAKRNVWEDMQVVMQRLGLDRGETGGGAGGD